MIKFGKHSIIEHVLVHKLNKISIRVSHIADAPIQTTIHCHNVFNDPISIYHFKNIQDWTAYNEKEQCPIYGGDCFNVLIERLTKRLAERENKSV